LDSAANQSSAATVAAAVTGGRDKQADPEALQGDEVPKD
jgi:hypothetical protein